MDTLDERTRAQAEKLIKLNEDITEKSIEVMIEAFRVLDTNKNGALEKHEVIKVLQLIGSNPDDNIDRIMGMLDTSGDGKVDMAEFFHLAQHVKFGQTEKNELTKAFEVFDKDRNGKICKKELKAVLKVMEQYTDDEEVDVMMQSADLDGDGYLDIKELVALLSS